MTSTPIAMYRITLAKEGAADPKGATTNETSTVAAATPALDAVTTRVHERSSMGDGTVAATPACPDCGDPGTC